MLESISFEEQFDWKQQDLCASTVDLVGVWGGIVFIRRSGALSGKGLHAPSAESEAGVCGGSDRPFVRYLCHLQGGRPGAGIHGGALVNRPVAVGSVDLFCTMARPGDCCVLTPPQKKGQSIS